MISGASSELVRALYAALGIELRRTWGREALARCFANPDAHHHLDRTPSTSVNLHSGAWYCHGCGASGGAYDAAIHRGHTPRTAMELLSRHGFARPRLAVPQRRAATQHPRLPPTEVKPQLNEADIERWAAALAANKPILDQLRWGRGITAEVLARHRVGLAGGRLTIPAYEAEGGLAGLMRYDPRPGRTGAKMLALPGSRRVLFPAPEALLAGPLVLCEGEPDALAALSHGIAAVAVPGVAGWRSDWAPRLRRFDVTVCMDCDADGRAAAARIAADLTAAGVTHRIVDLAPHRDDGHDLTDALLADPGAARELLT